MDSRCQATVINLLCKGSERHCRQQLGKTPAQHIADIRAEIADAVGRGLKVNLYLEDWSNGISLSPDYVFSLMDALRHEPVERFMLPDTLGILDPYDTFDYVKRMVKTYPELRFDFHAHNDYDLATSNLFAALKVGASGCTARSTVLRTRRQRLAVECCRSDSRHAPHVNWH